MLVARGGSGVRGQPIIHLSPSSPLLSGNTICCCCCCCSLAVRLFGGAHMIYSWCVANLLCRIERQLLWLCSLARSQVKPIQRQYRFVGLARSLMQQIPLSRRRNNNNRRSRLPARLELPHRWVLCCQPADRQTERETAGGSSLANRAPAE